jgi:hypothetical protein
MLYITLRTTCTTFCETLPPWLWNDHVTRLSAVRSLVASGRAVVHNLEGGTPDVTPNQVLIDGIDHASTYLMTTTYDLV